MKFKKLITVVSLLFMGIGFSSCQNIETKSLLSEDKIPRYFLYNAETEECLSESLTDIRKCELSDKAFQIVGT